MRKNDLWSGIIIIILSLAFLIGSLRMPWDDVGFDWYGAPGLMPLVLSLIMAFFGALLTIRALKGNRFYAKLEAEAESQVTESEDDPGVTSVEVELPKYLQVEKIRVLLVVLLCALYAFALLGNIPYILATALFVAAFILLFRGGGWLKSSAVGVITATVVWLIFAKIFGVFLP